MYPNLRKVVRIYRVKVLCCCDILHHCYAALLGWLDFGPGDEAIAGTYMDFYCDVVEHQHGNVVFLM